MAEKYREKGLTIVAVSKQPKAEVQKFVDELSAKHPIVCESTDSMRAYGCNAYPSSFLVGPNGRILWTGHPADLKDELVETTLGKIKLMPALSKGLSAHAKSLEKLKYGAVLAKVDADLKAAKLTAEDDKACATALQEWLGWYASSSLEAAQEQVEKGDAYRAFVTLGDVEEAFKGHALATKAKEALGKLKADSKHALEIKAGQMLDAIRKELGGERKKDKIAEALKPLLAKKYAETKAGKEAVDLLDGKDDDDEKKDDAQPKDGGGTGEATE